MNNEHPIIEERLNRVAPTKLSPEERERVWSFIHMRIANTPMVTPSPYSIRLLITHNSYTMVSAFVALLLLIGGGATVAASDSARPGDALFAVDRAVENVRIALASDDKEGELRVRFANERVNEFENIIEEGKSKRLARVSDDSQAEGSMQAKTAPMALKVATEDTFSATGVADDSGESQDSDEDAFDEESKEHIAEGLSATLRFFAEASVESDADARGELDQVLARLNGVIRELPEGVRAELRIDEDNRVRVEADGNDEGKIEVRSEGLRTKVEFKDGVVSVETKTDDDSSDDSNDDSTDDKGGNRGDDNSNDDSNDDSSSNTSGIEIEADIFLDTTIVKVEINDQKQLFVTNKKTRADIVSAIATEFDLDTALVDSVLNIENENRISLPTDSLLGGGGNSNDDLNGDDSSEDSDDSDDDSNDDDDDNGGHGGDDDEEDDD